MSVEKKSAAGKGHVLKQQNVREHQAESATQDFLLVFWKCRYPGENKKGIFQSGWIVRDLGNFSVKKLFPLIGRYSGLRKL